MDLKAIKRQVMTAYFQDGLFELILGLSLALTGCVLLIPDGFGMLYLPIVLLSISLPAAKKRYVAPRVGYVSLAPKRKGRVRLVLRVGITLLLGILVVLTAMYSLPPWLHSLLDALFAFEWWTAVIGVFLAAMFAVSAFRSGIARFYAFALLFGTGALVASLFNVGRGVRATLLFVSAGSVMMASGLVVFRRFLRNNPVLP